LGSRRKKTFTRSLYLMGGNDIKDEDLEAYKVLRDKKNVKKVLKSTKTYAKPKEEE